MELAFLAQDKILGFVITAPLWEEREAPGGFHVPHFLQVWLAEWDRLGVPDSHATGEFVSWPATSVCKTLETSG